MRGRVHHPVPEQGRWLDSVLNGHDGYYAVPDNRKGLHGFRRAVTRYRGHALWRRSQNAPPRLGAHARPREPRATHPRALHPWPNQRFGARTQPCRASRWHGYGPGMDARTSRRSFVATGALVALGMVQAERVRALIEEVARGELASGRGRFLSPGELVTLRAVTARLLPGPPEGPGPGALEVHAAEAIDLLLGAFELDPPLIHAGGPFSGRAGGSRDDFAHFVPLDAQATFGWRIRLEGSRGLPEREFAGPVVGLQEIYRLGLERLNERAQARTGGGFASAPTATQDALLASREAVVRRFVTAAVYSSLEALCGPPEYGGNHALAGWLGLEWRGDAEPDGFTAEEVSAPDPLGTIVGAQSANAGALSPHARREILARVAPVLADSGRRGPAEWSDPSGGEG
jgi:hypothetical protein